MKRNEKITYCRKKLGLSQEALGEKLGVSRQAISKWETGESQPELDHLVALSKVFFVSTDWLLSEDDPPETGNGWQNPADSGEGSAKSADDKSYPDWVDHLPASLAKTVRRYGWLLGVYVAVIGGILSAFGGLMKFMVSMMFHSAKVTTSSLTTNPFGSMVWDGGVTEMYNHSVNAMFATNPIDVIGTILLTVGMILLIGGIFLAIWLKKKYSR